MKVGKGFDDYGAAAAADDDDDDDDDDDGSDHYDVNDDYDN